MVKFEEAVKEVAKQIVPFPVEGGNVSFSEEQLSNECEDSEEECDEEECDEADHSDEQQNAALAKQFGSLDLPGNQIEEALTQAERNLLY